LEINGASRWLEASTGFSRESQNPSIAAATATTDTLSSVLDFCFMSFGNNYFLQFAVAQFNIHNYDKTAGADFRRQKNTVHDPELRGDGRNLRKELFADQRIKEKLSKLWN
jgi:hypothetical protein